MSHSGWARLGFWIDGTHTALALLDAVEMKSQNGTESVVNDSHLTFGRLRVELGVSQVVWRRHEDLSLKWKLLALLIAAPKDKDPDAPIRIVTQPFNAKLFRLNAVPQWTLFWAGNSRRLCWTTSDGTPIMTNLF